MSSLALYFNSIGKKVAGYDKTPSDITNSLEQIGIAIQFNDAVEEIPNEFKNEQFT